MLTAVLLVILNIQGPITTQPAPAVAGAEPIRATGIARAPARYQGVRARLMAERGAQIVAVRNLLAKMRGVKSLEQTGSGQVHLEGRVQGIQYQPAVFRPDGTAEVTVELRP